MIIIHDFYNPSPPEGFYSLFFVFYVCPRKREREKLKESEKKVKIKMEKEMRKTRVKKPAWPN